MAKIIGTPILVMVNGGGGSSVDNFSTLPPPVANLTAEAGDATVTLAWEETPDKYKQYLSDEVAYIAVLKKGSIPESPTDGDYIVKLTKDGYVVTMETGSPIAGIALKDLPEGTLVNIMEGGVLTPFYLAKHDYEADLNEGGRELLVRKDVHSTMQWHTTAVNAYDVSTIDTYLNSSYTNLFTDEIVDKMATTAFEYALGKSSSTTSVLERAVFILSAPEFGVSELTGEGEVLPTADLLKIAYKDNVATQQWTRTPNRANNDTVSSVNTSGAIAGVYPTATHGVRPAFTLPNDMRVVTTANVDGSYDLIV